jgi:hypothetical protein
MNAIITPEIFNTILADIALGNPRGVAICSTFGASFDSVAPSISGSLCSRWGPHKRAVMIHPHIAFVLLRDWWLRRGDSVDHHCDYLDERHAAATTDPWCHSMNSVIHFRRAYSFLPEWKFGL